MTSDQKSVESSTSWACWVSPRREEIVAAPASLDLVGVHGSLTRHEMLVPCVVVA